MNEPLHPPQFEPDDLPDAFRDAIAMGLSGWRQDGAGVAAIWNGTPSKPALIYALSRLPSTLIRAVSAREGYTLDPEELLQGLLEELPIYLKEEK